VASLAGKREAKHTRGANDMTKVANDSLLTDVLSEAHSLAGDRQVWAALLSVVLIVGLTGPFGTYTQLAPFARLHYWLAAAVPTFWLGYLVSYAAMIWAEDKRISAYPALALGVSLASLAVTLWLSALHAVIFSARFWPDALRLFPYVAVITGVICLLFETRPWQTTAPPAHSNAEDPAWLDRLPKDLGKNLIFLHAQDHYLRAETPLGDTLIRATLTEATQELGDFGLRVHRSWWVAHWAIRSYASHKGSPVLIVEGGTKIPIGRTYRRAVIAVLRTGAD